MIWETNVELYVVGCTELSDWTLGARISRPVRSSDARPAAADLVGAGLVPPDLPSYEPGTRQPRPPGLPIVLASEHIEVSRHRGIARTARHDPRSRTRSRAARTVCLGDGARSQGRTVSISYRRRIAAIRARDVGELARLRETKGGPGAFDLGALRLILPVTSSETDLHPRWPSPEDTATDCQATITFRNPQLAAPSS